VTIIDIGDSAAFYLIATYIYSLVVAQFSRYKNLPSGGGEGTFKIWNSSFFQLITTIN
jgi:hypothetical protein